LNEDTKSCNSDGTKEGVKGTARHKVKAVHAAYTQLIVGTEKCF